MLAHITSWPYRHRRLVVGAWLAILIGLNVAAMTYGGANKQDFVSPGTGSKAAVDLLNERFPAQAGDTVTIVMRDADGVLSPDVRAVTQPLVEQVRALPHIVSVTAPWDPAGAGQVAADGRTGYASVQLDTSAARFPVAVAHQMMDLAAGARTHGVEVELGGQAIDNAHTAASAPKARAC